jgi:hypothetical protein
MDDTCSLSENYVFSSKACFKLHWRYRRHQLNSDKTEFLRWMKVWRQHRTHAPVTQWSSRPQRSFFLCSWIGYFHWFGLDSDFVMRTQLFACITGSVMLLCHSSSTIRLLFPTHLAYFILLMSPWFSAGRILATALWLVYQPIASDNFSRFTAIRLPPSPQWPPCAY